jgi:ElaB/YqjD/DUF883 family membrane-anchored ribosome-binding protein
MANRIEMYQTEPQAREESASWLDTSEWARSLEEKIGDSPMLCLGVAFAFGLVVGWLVKR